MTASAYVSVPRSLMAREINGYSQEAFEAKKAFHRDGMSFLRKLARALGLAEGTYDVRSNAGGVAVSGEVTLHSDDLYVQLGESFVGVGVQVLYRSCSSRKDYTGGRNHFAPVSDFRGEAGQARMLDELRKLMNAERQRKALAAAACAS